MNILKKEIRELLSSVLECSQDIIFDDTELSDIGYDSLKFITSIVRMEAKYNIEILDSDLDIENFKNVASICETLKKYLFNRDKKVYKCLITDCDGVLWRGISGEGGDDGAHFDSNTRELCNLLIELRRKGVLLAICSKNEQENIVAMLDIAGISANEFVLIENNVRDKAESISFIIQEVGFYADSVVYLDDSDAEIEYVQSKHPSLNVMKAHSGDFAQTLAEMFAELPTGDKIDRTSKFREQKEREKIFHMANSLEEYNRILETKFTCGLATVGDIFRLSELSQRANRFNLTGQRYTASDLDRMLSNDEYSIYSLAASDKFGEMGVVAMAVLHGNIIESFIMSCRAFGRGFEFELIKLIKQNNNNDIMGLYHPTGKNEYCKNFYANLGVKYELF